MDTIRLRRGLTLAASTTVLMLGAALPASAHVVISPNTSAPGSFELYTIRVPNELADQATIAVEVTLPPGFTLGAAESVPGWHTAVRRAAGRPVAVSWSGGQIPADTFTSFELQGRNPAGRAAMSWRAIQRYERTAVTWSGPLGSENPAPVVRLGLANGSSAVPADVAGALRAAGVDDLARSRAAVGIALGILTLGLILVPVAVSCLRRRQTFDEDDLGTSPPLTPAISRGLTATSAGYQRRPVSSGSRRG